MPEPAVLIISTVVDVATDAVVNSLAERGIRHHRVNTEDYPFDRSLTLDYQAARNEGLSFGATAVSPVSIWYRRLRSPTRPESMDAGIYDFCLRENRAALLGGLCGQSVRWMSHPSAVWQAELKPFQLRVAQDAGFRIPRTIVSNDPVAIRQAYVDFGPLIVKPVRSGYFKEGDDEFSIFTSLIAEEHLSTLDSAKWTPSIYQELVPKRYDVRVTCVGRRLFSAAIHSQTDPAAVVDWRRTDNPLLPHSRLDLPVEVSDRVLDLMERLGLSFGCVDLVLTPSNEYVFLEVNPSGQWLWLDDQLDFGISSAVAAWLARD
ncbi:MvdC/MvdD family ATP grasp protein [Tahibacter sp.]|uniref:MvdC/MvdD family ATP grasp protein n=1 Tax=Tahibacter sp. TaxID=2056211 RepID=UPI0028C4AF9C|nr:hypothetical protein [Tahibacter sp.]